MLDSLNVLHISGVCLLILAGVICAGAFGVCWIMQDVIPGVIPEVFGFVAYFCGPLPIVPAVIALCGTVLALSGFIDGATERTNGAQDGEEST